MIYPMVVDFKVKELPQMLSTYCVTHDLFAIVKFLVLTVTQCDNQTNQDTL